MLFFWGGGGEKKRREKKKNKIVKTKNMHSHLLVFSERKSKGICPNKNGSNYWVGRDGKTGNERDGGIFPPYLYMFLEPRENILSSETKISNVMT